MIDIHHHLLYGLDDGSPDLETSLAMAEMAIADGITHIVCTPHASGRYTYLPEENEARLAELRSRLASRITLGLGCDFHLSYDNIEDALAHPSRYTINGKSYLLVEFPDYGIPATISETLYELNLAGMTPILTHPERNETLKVHPERIADWLRIGCLVQITAGSLAGRFGKQAQRLSNTFLKDNWVHFIATDAHNLTSRPPQMREAYDFITRHYDEETAHRLCVENPLCVFEGKPMHAQPEPARVFDDGPEGRRGSFFSRLFSR